VHAQVWQDFELAPLRALVREEDMSNAAPGEGARSSSGSGGAKSGAFAPPKLLWRSIVASMQGLRFGGSPAVGQDQYAQLLLPHLQPAGVCPAPVCPFSQLRAIVQIMQAREVKAQSKLRFLCRQQGGGSSAR
jgi:hypothetical protein